MEDFPACPHCKNGELATVSEGASTQYVVCPECDSTFTERASLGDTIVCHLKTQDKRLEAVLATEDSLAYGNLLVASGRWKVKR